MDVIALKYFLLWLIFYFILKLNTIPEGGSTNTCRTTPEHCPGSSGLMGSYGVVWLNLSVHQLTMKIIDKMIQ